MKSKPSSTISPHTHSHTRTHAVNKNVAHNICNRENDVHIHTGDITQWKWSREIKSEHGLSKSNLFTRVRFILFHCAAFLLLCVVSLRWLSFWVRSTIFSLTLHSFFFIVCFSFHFSIHFYLASHSLVARTFFLSFFSFSFFLVHFYYVLFGYVNRLQIA